jgi:outer membrane lipoprotein-sorting protein
MISVPTFSRRARWAVPAGAVAIAAAVTAGSVISVAQASPELPLRTPAQLLAAVAGQTGPPPALTGTVVETASLGIPALPGSSSPNSMISLLAGSHTIKVWYANPTHLRLSVPVTLSETDLVRNGSTVWLWQSSGNTVTKMQLPAKSAKADTPSPSKVPLTPQQAASQVLAAVGPSTLVSVDRNVTVAGQAAYQLVLSPKAATSLISRVSIAVDAAKNVPLRVQVFAKGAHSAAFQVGFTSISYVTPAASNFNFSAPSGAKVKVETPSQPSGHASKSGAQPTVIGKDWLSVAVLPASALSGLTGPGKSASGSSTSEIASALMGSATSVHGTWGSGKLLHTSLVNMLITSNGHVLVGAVAPSVLYSAAAQVK